MVAGGKRDDTVLIVHPLVIVLQVGQRGAPVSVAQRQCQHILHHGGTVHMTETHYQMFFVHRLCQCGSNAALHQLAEEVFGQRHRLIHIFHRTLQYLLVLRVKLQLVAPQAAE